MNELDEAAWRTYISANALAKDEYIRRPIARPHVAGHFLCLCCDILTTHPSSVCMSRQSRSQEWSDLANDPDPEVLERLRLNEARRKGCVA